MAGTEWARLTASGDILCILATDLLVLHSTKIQLELGVYALEILTTLQLSSNSACDVASSHERLLHLGDESLHVGMLLNLQHVLVLRNRDGSFRQTRRYSGKGSVWFTALALQSIAKLDYISSIDVIILVIATNTLICHDN